MREGVWDALSFSSCLFIVSLSSSLSSLFILIFLKKEGRKTPMRQKKQQTTAKQANQKHLITGCRSATPLRAARSLGATTLSFELFKMPLTGSRIRGFKAQTHKYTLGVEDKTNRSLLCRWEFSAQISPEPVSVREARRRAARGKLPFR